LPLNAEEAAGFRTEARAETGAPLAPERTDRVLATPPVPVPLVVAVEFRVGVRFAAPADDDDAVLEAASRRGVPPGGGLAAVVDMVCTCICICVYVSVLVAFVACVAVRLGAGDAAQICFRVGAPGVQI
jgi:hypothetical protein